MPAPSAFSQAWHVSAFGWDGGWHEFDLLTCNWDVQSCRVACGHLSWSVETVREICRMAEREAWVTMVTSDSYVVGAVVLAHSLQSTCTVSRQRPLLCMVTSEVLLMFGSLHPTASGACPVDSRRVLRHCMTQHSCRTFVRYAQRAGRFSPERAFSSKTLLTSPLRK